MADVDVSVNDNIAIVDTAAKYELGPAVTDLTVLSKELEANDDNTPFCVNAYIGGTTGVHTIKDAPGAGRNIILKKLTIISSDKNVVRIGAGSQCGWIDSLMFGPYVFNTEESGAGYKVGTQYVLDFKKPIKLPTNKALTGDVDATGYTVVTAEGLIKIN